MWCRFVVIVLGLVISLKVCAQHDGLGPNRFEHKGDYDKGNREINRNNDLREARQRLKERETFKAEEEKRKTDSDTELKTTREDLEKLQKEIGDLDATIKKIDEEITSERRREEPNRAAMENMVSQYLQNKQPEKANMDIATEVAREVDEVNNNINRLEREKAVFEQNRRDVTASKNKKVWVNYQGVCKDITYTTGDNYPCHSGYNEIFHKARSAPDSCCDSIRICEKLVSKEGSECSVGYYIAGLNYGDGQHRVNGIIPAKLPGHVRLMANFNEFWVEVTNQLTGSKHILISGGPYDSYQYEGHPIFFLIGSRHSLSRGSYDIPAQPQDQPIIFSGGGGDGTAKLTFSAYNIEDRIATEENIRSADRNLQDLDNRISSIESQILNKTQRSKHLNSTLTELNASKQKIAQLKQSMAEVKNSAEALQKKIEEQRKIEKAYIDDIAIHDKNIDKATKQINEATGTIEKNEGDANEKENDDEL